MYKYLFSSDEFMQIWSILTMVIFFISFIYIIISTVRMNKKDVEYISELPLQENKNE